MTAFASARAIPGPTVPPGLLRAAASVAALLLAGVPRVAADGPGSFCVTCTGPDATYVCEVRDRGAAVAAGMQGQLQCIQSLARRHGHQTCAADRRTATSCHGPLHEVTMENAAPAPSAAAVPTPIAAGHSRLPDAPPQESPSRAPPTPEPTALEKAGQAIGSTAQKTWTCMTSLFKDC